MEGEANQPLALREKLPQSVDFILHFNTNGLFEVGNRSKLWQASQQTCSAKSKVGTANCVCCNCIGGGAACSAKAAMSISTALHLCPLTYSYGREFRCTLP